MKRNHDGHMWVQSGQMNFALGLNTGLWTGSGLKRFGSHRAERLTTRCLHLFTRVSVRRIKALVLVLVSGRTAPLSELTL